MFLTQRTFFVTSMSCKNDEVIISTSISHNEDDWYNKAETSFTIEDGEIIFNGGEVNTIYSYPIGPYGEFLHIIGTIKVNPTGVNRTNWKNYYRKKIILLK
ncbi:hypothetical protein [Victivallis sp. Marseille-Q1083]|uniref:hypothetical protein n=1 Tax=Victivallis sp. Marseille-Q1083 TaxID=2717288 RepID=UPI00158D4BB0|nr:hypothetical protein [Victivallis sp. Marseille-Q1083]